MISMHIVGQALDVQVSCRIAARKIFNGALLYERLWIHKPTRFNDRADRVPLWEQ